MKIVHKLKTHQKIKYVKMICQERSGKDQNQDEMVKKVIKRERYKFQKRY